MKIKHTLVVPCFNEEGNVGSFLKAAVNAMRGYTDSYEIVFVNDGSRDHTMEALEKLYRENPSVRIKVIGFARNFGKEAAIFAGLHEAEGEYVTLIDADMQQRPEVAVEMGRILDAKPEVDVVAAYQEKRKEGKLITACKEAFYKVISKMTKINFISDASDFRTMRHAVVDTILSLSEYHRFSKGIFAWIGYNTYSIPYEVQERESGESNWNFMSLLKYAFEGIIAYTDMPLKLPMYAGVFSLVLSVLIALIQWIFGWMSAGTAHISCMLLIGFGFVLLAQGVLGVYLGKVHTQVKNRPIYIVKTKLSRKAD